MPGPIDLADLKPRNGITIIRLAEQRTAQGQRQCVCECPCGAEFTTTVGHLQSGHTKSCGCLQRKTASKRLRRLRRAASRKAARERRRAEAARRQSHDPSRLGTGAVVERLDIDRHTLQNWHKKCPPHEGKPLRRFPEKGHKTGRLNTYLPCDVERIEYARQAAADGRYVDFDGVAWLSCQKTLEELKEVQPSICQRTLYDWSRSTKDSQGHPPRGCVHLGGRRLAVRMLNLDQSPGGPTAWYKEADVQAIKASVQKINDGEYTKADLPPGLKDPPPGPYFSETAAAAKFGCTPKTIDDWEKAGKITPILLPRKRGAAGRPFKVYPLPQLEQAHRDGQRQRALASDVNPDGTIAVPATADLLGVTPGYVSVLVQRGRLHPVTNERRNHRRWDGVFRFKPDEVLRLKREREARRKQKPPPDWVTAGELYRRHGIASVKDRKEASEVLADFRRRCPHAAGQFPNGREDQTQLAWYYDAEEFERFLEGGHTPVECEGSVTPTDQPEPGAANGQAEAPEAATRNRDSSPVVPGSSWKLPVLVRGTPKTLTTHGAWKVIKLLADAYPRRLSMEEIEATDGNARRILRELRGDPDWQSVIDPAVTKGRGYGLLG